MLPCRAPRCTLIGLSYGRTLHEHIGAHLDRTAAPPEPVPLETVENLDAKGFRERDLRTDTPVVLRGAARGWKAIGKWSPLAYGGCTCWRRWGRGR